MIIYDFIKDYPIQEVLIGVLIIIMINCYSLINKIEDDKNETANNT